MAVFFQGGELLEIAMGMEASGLSFYTALVDKTRLADAKAMYQKLAAEERKHIDTFQQILKTLGSYKPDEEYKGQYMLYLKALVDGTVFPSVEEAKRMAATISGETEALGIGIQAEKDSILFYSGVRNFIQPSDRAIIDRISSEERNHLRLLSEMKTSFRK